MVDEKVGGCLSICFTIGNDNVTIIVRLVVVAVVPDVAVLDLFLLLINDCEDMACSALSLNVVEGSLFWKKNKL